MPSDDPILERIARLEEAVRQLSALVTDQHDAVLQELKHNIYDIHRHIHEQGCRDSAAYVNSHMQGVPRFDDRPKLLMHIAALAQGIEGDVLEFGVAGGVSLALWGEHLPDRRVFGFDSFEGLPEDWFLTVKKGAYAVPQERVKRAPANATLIAGWFEDSLPEFLKTYEGKIALIHVDSDLYSSAVTVLRHLRPHIRPGCIVEFDEYMNYGGWREHEFKAWQEFVAAHGVDYEYLGYTRRGAQCAVRIKTIGA